MKLSTQALVFDAYGTLFDVHSVIALCDRKFPGQGAELSKLWRTKQLEYTWLRSLVGRYEDFWSVTEFLRYDAPTVRTVETSHGGKARCGRAGLGQALYEA